MWSFLDPDDQSRAEDSYPQLDRQLSSQGRGLCQPKVCGDPYNPNASLTEGNLFSSVLSCRERGQGTSAYTKLQEILFLSETSERSVKCNAWGLVCDPRIWVVLWFQEVHVKYHPSHGCCPCSSHSPTTDKSNPAAPVVTSRVITCQSYLPTAFRNLHFLKDLQLVSQ